MSEHAEHSEHADHVVPVKVYLGVFTALLVLTYVTVAAARLDLGSLNVVVALLIAGFKASLVVYYFMHLKFSPRLTWLWVIGSFLWLAFLIGITVSDYMSRGWLGVMGS